MRQDVVQKLVEALYHRIDAAVAEVEAGLKSVESAAIEIEAEITTTNYGKLPRYAQDVCRAYWQGRVRSIKTRANSRK